MSSVVSVGELNPYEIRRSYRLGAKEAVSVYDYGSGMSVRSAGSVTRRSVYDDVVVSDRRTAEALDASDGVMDGRVNGSRIVQSGRDRGGISVSGRRQALELDAADGVIDGKFHGTQIFDRSDEDEALIRDLRRQLRIVVEERDELATRASDDAYLRTELDRLTSELQRERQGRERDVAALSVSREETIAIEEQASLINLQRRLLQEKDEEIRNLSQLAAAHKEQINLLYRRLDLVEVDEILDDKFQVKDIDLDSFTPEQRARISLLLNRNELQQLKSVGRGGSRSGKFHRQSSTVRKVAAQSTQWTNRNPRYEKVDEYGSASDRLRNLRSEMSVTREGNGYDTYTTTYTNTSTNNKLPTMWGVSTAPPAPPRVQSMPQSRPAKQYIPEPEDDDGDGLEEF